LVPLQAHQLQKSNSVRMRRHLEHLRSIVEINLLPTHMHCRCLCALFRPPLFLPPVQSQSPIWASWFLLSPPCCIARLVHNEAQISTYTTRTSPGFHHPVRPWLDFPRPPLPSCVRPACAGVLVWCSSASTPVICVECWLEFWLCWRESLARKKLSAPTIQSAKLHNTNTQTASHPAGIRQQQHHWHMEASSPVSCVCSWPPSSPPSTSSRFSVSSFGRLEDRLFTAQIGITQQNTIETAREAHTRHTQ
jgi:hypothetical protein